MTLQRSQPQAKFDILLNQDIHSSDDLVDWIKSCDILDAQLGQDYAWKYIHQTTNTIDETAKKEYKDFLQDIYPQWIVISDQIGRKLIACKYTAQLPSQYHNYIR